jgi:Tfp pilus assembly protein PilF
MSQNLTSESETREDLVDSRSEHHRREKLRLVLYGVLTLALIGTIVYFFVASYKNRQRVASLYLTRAKQFISNDSVDDAAEALRKASVADPGSREIQTEQLKTGIFKIANQSDSLARQLDLEKLDQAEEKCKELLRRDPGSAELTALLGIIYAHKDQPILAMETYQAAANMAPDYANVRNYWGYSAYQWQYPQTWEELATEKFNEAKRLDPKYVSPLLNLARLELGKKQFESAINIFSDAEKIADNKQMLYTLWGVTLDEWGRELEGTNKAAAFEKYSEALDKYGRAEALNPQVALIHYDKANALGDSGLNRIDDAIKEYTKAIELEPNLAYAHVGIAQLLVDRPNAQRKDLEEAANHLIAAITLTDQTIKQYELRKTKADDHAQKILDRWTEQRKQEMTEFQRLLKVIQSRLSADLRNTEAEKKNGNK